MGCSSYPGGAKTQVRPLLESELWKAFGAEVGPAGVSDSATTTKLVLRSLPKGVTEAVVSRAARRVFDAFVGERTG